MLAHMRKFAGSFFIKVLLIILLASFVLWGAGDMIRNSGSGVVMRVGNVSYSAQEFNMVLGEQINAISNQFGITIDNNLLKDPMFQDLILNQIVNKSLILQEAKANGLLVSDEMVKYEIATIPYFQKDGKFNKDLFQMFLSNSGMSESRFIEVIKNDIISQNMAMVFNVSRDVPRIKAKNLAAARLAKRDLKIIEISSSDVKIGKEPTNEELQEIYENNKTNFSIPEERNVSYFEFSLGDIKTDVKVKDEELHEVYKARKSLFLTPEKRKIRQMIFNSKEDADKAHNELKNGKSFDDVAKDFTKEKKSHNMGEITKDGLQEDIAEAVFATKKGDYTGVYKSPLGYHIFLVDSIKEQTEKSYQDVKAELEKSYVNEKKYEIFAELANNVSDRILSGKTLKEISEEYGFVIKTVKGIKASDKIDNSSIISSENFMKSVFSTEQGALSSVSPNHDSSKYFVVQVDSVKPQEFKDFSLVESDIRKIWKDKEMLVALDNMAKDVVSTLQESKNIEEAKSKFGLSSRSLKANYYTKDLLEYGQNAFSQALALGDKSFSSPILTSKKSYVIFYCEGITKANDNEILTKLDEIKSELAQSVANEFYGEFLAGLRKKYEVVYDKKLIFPS